jgi:hypothetical protein
LTANVSDFERLDALMLLTYGCALAEYAFRLYFHGYSDGFRKGRKQGYSAGRRAAKGLEPAGAHGHPIEIEKNLLQLMIHKVDGRTSGATVEQSIKEFFEIMRLGNTAHRKAVGPSPIKCELPSIKKAKRAYYRHRKTKCLVLRGVRGF